MEPRADHPEDRQLVTAVLAEDGRAIEVFVARLRCIPRMLGALNQRLGGLLDREDLDDLTQEALTAFWTRIDTYSGKAALETWAYGFCLNVFMAALRKNRRRQAMDSVDEEALEDDARRAQAFEYEELYRGLERLEEKETRVIRLKYFDGMTFDEIGVRLQISPRTAKSCFYRGMKRLQALLRPPAKTK